VYVNATCVALENCQEIKPPSKIIYPYVTQNTLSGYSLMLVFIVLVKVNILSSGKPKSRFYSSQLFTMLA